ncbi:hypothetical protein [uncultured Thiodictyon sp.]|uniref:hypothetical protein n=1 Tax=uncultured Thiodictyon sp. TaxID=1846217 RepID=UPI0025DA3875|nr:hypothetical protein [uncultured Thiodictyon sp.]
MSNLPRLLSPPTPTPTQGERTAGNGMNARFWIFCRGPVHLTLRPGQTLTYHRAWLHDEGWSSTQDSWTLEAGQVVHEWATDGCDCDGRMSTRGRCTCAIEDLRAGCHDEDDGATYPRWDQYDYSQRDYSAGAAGY